MKGIILIPAYNSAATLSEVLSECSAYHDLEIVVINDGSTDETGNIAAKHGVQVIGHRRNMGKGAALKTGFRYASGRDIDFIITLDADKQHPADMIPQFIDMHRSFPDDVILGRRKRDKNMPLTRKISNSVSAALISLRIKQRIYDAQCGFRLIPKKYLSWHFSTINGFIFESEALISLAMNKARFRFIPIPTLYPRDGESKMTYFEATFGFIFMYISSFFKSYRQEQHEL